MKFILSEYFLQMSAMKKNSTNVYQ